MSKTKPYSNGDVKRAGTALLEDNLDSARLEHTLDVLTYWRNAHILPLQQTEQLLLKYIFKIDKNAFLAKRLKRFDSIRKKLRYAKAKNKQVMQLTNVQDIGGLRIVISDLNKLKNVKKVLLNELCFYENERLIKFDDYISSPKENGYRGIHLVAKFLNEYSDYRKIEVQIRTRLQHSWATSLEIIDIFTQQNLKSDDGEVDFLKFFKNVSDQFALIDSSEFFKKNDMERLTKDYLSVVLMNKKFIYQCIEIRNFLDKSDQFGKTLQQNFIDYRNLLSEVENTIIKSKEGYALLRLHTVKGSVDIEIFESKNYLKATQRYAEYEKLLLENPNWVIALVSTNALGGLKEAYPNYFADSELFLKYLGLIKIAANLGEVGLHKYDFSNV